MALRLSETNPSDRGLFGEWYFPSRQVFMKAAAFDAFELELAAYVRGDVLGRSFLIAAHRGVGKTSLVLRAVDDLQRAAIREVADLGQNPVANLSSGPEPRRPLLVKLTGSALLPPKPTADAGEKPAAPAAETALQQLTIALYRAFAREAAEAFTLHAREIDARQSESRRPRTNLPELAAQFTLDLDLAPELGALRAFWSRLGRLRDGVLWPRQVGNNGRADRGLREIVALATANQVFKVCIGDLSLSLSAKQSAEDETKQEVAAKIDLKDPLNRLWSLGAGALVGGALLRDQGAGAAVAAGLGTALFSSLALSWSAARTRKSERSADYKFIMNPSLETLERDLPIVIERIRDAGLAPVFLIDELDKVDAPEACIKEIIGRLKNLTTDYGFFCFLTDRDYYDELEQKLRRLAFPLEYTFFSRRVLITYRPAELARYVRQLWTIDETQPQDAQAAWIVTCVVLHGGRLNTIGIRREIARICNADGSLRPPVNDICTQAEYLLQMTVQLAIEHVLRSRDIHRRVHDDDSFAQLALDVLYMISRAWYDGRPVKIDEDSVRDDLVARRCVPGTPEQARETLRRTASDEDIRTLTEKAQRLARLLTSFKAIHAAILAEDSFKALPSPPPLLPAANLEESEKAKTATLVSLLLGIPGASPGLLAEEEDQPSTFRFLFNRYGVENPDDSVEKRLRNVEEAIAFFDEFVLAMGGSQLDIAALVSGGVLPTSVDVAVLSRTVELLRGDQSIDLLDSVPPNDLAQLTGFPGTALALSRAVVGVAALVSLIIRLSLDDRLGDRPFVTGVEALSGVERMLGVAPLVALMSQAQPGAASRASLRSPNSPLVDVLLQGDPGSFKAGSDWWSKAIEAWRVRLDKEAGHFEPKDVGARGSTAAWRDRVAHWLQGMAAEPPVELEDLVGAALGRLLPSLLRPDLDVMSVAEWSAFCMEMLPLSNERGLTWAFSAGLRALGFGRSVLLAAGDSEDAVRSVEKPPGVLYIDSGDGAFSGPPDRDSAPVFIVPEARRAEYFDVVNWLYEQKALSAKSA